MLTKRSALGSMIMGLVAALFLGACAGALPAGLVRAEGAASGDSAVVADPLIEFQGTLESLDTHTATVAGKVFAILPETEIHGSLALGSLVTVQAAIRADGDLVAKEIGQIDTIASDPGDESGSEFTGVVEAMAPEAWTIDGKVVSVTTETEIEGEIKLGDLVKVEASLGRDGALMAKEIKLAESSEDPEDMGDEAEFTGVVEAMAADVWTIDGKVVSVTTETEIEGEIKLGDLVKVEATLGSDGVLLAKEIKLASDSAGHEGESESDTDHVSAEGHRGDGGLPSTPEPGDDD